jgi:hypothetical protein
VIIKFDGQGDDGEIYECECINVDGAYVDVPEGIDLEPWAYEQITNLVNEYGGDWVNNNGGYGDIILDPINKTIDGNYYQRITEYHGWSENPLFK